MKPKYENITVKLIGTDGNPFALVGKVVTGLRRGGVKPAEIKEFQKEALSGDYNHVLLTCMQWVEVE